MSLTRYLVPATAETNRSWLAPSQAAWESSGNRRRLDGGLASVGGAKPARQILSDKKWEGATWFPGGGGGGGGSGDRGGGGGGGGPVDQSLRIPLTGRFYALAPIPDRQKDLLTLLASHAILSEDFLRTKVLPRFLRTSRCSLRILDWFVVDYAREKAITYEHYVPMLGRTIIVPVHETYSTWRDRWRRRRFDCFRRRHRIYFDMDGSTYETTVAQLHFFFIAELFGFLHYAETNVDAIEAHMKAKYKETAEEKQAAAAAGTVYMRKPLVNKVPVPAVVSTLPHIMTFVDGDGPMETVANDDDEEEEEEEQQQQGDADYNDVNMDD